MADSDRTEQTSESSEFEKLASDQKGSAGPIGEFTYFIRRTRKWWMLLVIVPLLLVGGLLVLGTTAGAPLIYALF